jgi:transcriptional regulator with PAS, ATPase and Fis domain
MLLENSGDTKQKLSLGGLSLEDMRSLADCIYEGVCLVDENGLVLIWNRGAENIYNITSDKIIGRHITTYFPKALLEEVRKTRVAKENVSHMPNDNSHILISATPLYVGGEFKGVVSTDRDYAEVMRLYADLENAQDKLSFLTTELKKNEGTLGDIIGNDANFIKKINIATQIAPAHTNVMITGESGTGKEVFARGIHEISGREGLFVPINCSAIPSELFESEFFGYAPGAFTGASRKGKAGFFELANGGTIFLDEVGEMPFSAQAKLLRVLQEREVVRVGGEKGIKLDVRVISATNKNLKEMMSHEKFREDLYYRLNVVEINLPALRERAQDIPLLVNHFTNEFARKNNRGAMFVQQQAMKVLSRYSWPGNVRELMNVLENIVVTSDSKIIEKNNIPEYILELTGAGGKAEEADKKNDSMDLGVAVRDMELEKIKKALAMCGNNKSRAASLLNIPRTTLYNKLEEYGLAK